MSQKIVLYFLTKKVFDNFGRFWRLCWKEFWVIFGIFLKGILGDVLGFLEGAPLRGALGRAPPPFCRAEILKKFSGKNVPENYTLFFWKKQVFPLKTS